MSNLEDLYREIILDHYRSPRNRGELPSPPAHKVEGFNPLCGDEVTIYLDVRDGVLQDLKLTGHGCSISQSSSSLMSAAVKGKPLDDVNATIDNFKQLMTGHESALTRDGRRRRSGPAHPGRTRRAPGRGQVSRSHQVRHVGVEHTATGLGRDRLTLRACRSSGRSTVRPGWDWSSSSLARW